jgi:two-component system, OmpR family, sensor histidine kinase KdpD
VRRWPDQLSLSAAGVAIVAVTLTLRVALHVTNTTIAALSYLLIVLWTATMSRLRAAIATCIAADLCLNYFFMPPFGTFRIADPENWMALFTFVAVSVVASSLSSALRDHALELTARRDELARLFDVSRDVLLTMDSSDAIGQLARFVSDRFDLEFVAICRPDGAQWDIRRAGSAALSLDSSELSAAFAGAERACGSDALHREYSAHTRMTSDAGTVQVVPLRVGMKAVGLLAVAGRTIEPATLDVLAGVVAIAIERAQFLEERETAELARRSEELKSALLASIGHDLRTPLTAIRVAASNLQASWLADSDRREQSDVILAEVERLHRLFQNILEMARIDAGAIAPRARWVHPSEIVEAAREQVDVALQGHQVDVELESDVLVRLDPLLTAAALAHLLENAAQYSPAASTISVRIGVAPDGLRINVRDRGPGVAAADLPHLFERFYRGAAARRGRSGTGMGLAIARGMLAAQHGHIWAENGADIGAQFSMVIPAASKSAGLAERL